MHDMQIVQSRINTGISHLVDLASGDVVQLVRTLPCHGYFERPRRPKSALAPNLIQFVLSLLDGIVHCVHHLAAQDVSSAVFQ